MSETKPNPIPLTSVVEKTSQKLFNFVATKTNHVAATALFTTITVATIIVINLLSTTNTPEYLYSILSLFSGGSLFVILYHYVETKTGTLTNYRNTTKHSTRAVHGSIFVTVMLVGLMVMNSLTLPWVTMGVGAALILLTSLTALLFFSKTEIELRYEKTANKKPEQK